MSDQLSRITMRKTTVNGSFDDVLIITGYVVEFEPEAPPKRDVLRPIIPDEPDTEVEVGYSKNALEPLTIEFGGRRIELSLSDYKMFRYVYDLYRAEGREEFDFEELSEVLTGDGCGKSGNALGKQVRQIATALAKIVSPISVIYERETVYVVAILRNET